MYMYCFNRLMWCSIDCLIETCAWPSDDPLYISFVYHSHGWPQWDSNPLALFCHFSPPSLIISLPVLISLATLILTHLNCFHLSLINIPFLVYLVSVVRSLYVSVPAFPSDIYGSCFSESGPFVIAFSLPECWPDLQLMSCVPTYVIVKPILSTQTFPSRVVRCLAAGSLWLPPKFCFTTSPLLTE